MDLQQSEISLPAVNLLRKNCRTSPPKVYHRVYQGRAPIRPDFAYRSKTLIFIDDSWRARRDSNLRAHFIGVALLGDIIGLRMHYFQAEGCQFARMGLQICSVVEAKRGAVDDLSGTDFEPRVAQNWVQSILEISEEAKLLKVGGEPGRTRTCNPLISPDWSKCCTV